MDDVNPTVMFLMFLSLTANLHKLMLCVTGTYRQVLLFLGGGNSETPLSVAICT